MKVGTEPVSSASLLPVQRQSLQRWFQFKLEDASASIVEMRPLVGGLMNETHLVHVQTSDVDRLQSFVVRWAPSEGVMAPYDIALQFKVMEALGTTAVPVPKTYWLEMDRYILGSEFWAVEYVMAETPGRLLDMEAPHFKRRFKSYVTTLAAIHDVDWAGDGIGELLGVNEAAPWQPLMAMLERHRDILPVERRAFFSDARSWLLENRPASWNLSLVHGDCSLSNYMFRDEEVVAVLDWELASISDPLADVGFYCCLIERYLRDATPAIRQEQRDLFLATYANETRRALDTLPFWETLACYRNALFSEHPKYALHATGDYRNRLAKLISA